VEGSDRRSFFKNLLRDAAKTAVEVSDALKGAPEAVPDTQALDPYQLTWGGPGMDAPPVVAEPATHAATDDELRGLAEEVGLGARIDDVLAHARRSVRLTRGDFTGGSRVGGAPDLPPGFEWPKREEEELAFIAQIRLDELAAADDSLPLPARGLLLFFFDLDRRPAGLRPDDLGSIRVVHVDADPVDLEVAGPDRVELVELPLRFSTEVTLPGETAGLPASLALDIVELDAWQRLRERLAALQGVEVEDRAVDWHALHRLLGHPDTTHEGMALDAQLVYNGVDLNTGDRYFDPRVGTLESGADDWRLLLQLSSDDELGLALGYPVGRLFVWIREEDLKHGRFGDVWAFVR
jgi:uncharacterized protein YwqG